MNHNKFLSSLREALEGNMSEQAIKENIQYYKTYIEEEVKKGRAEKEVIEELGDPWIIAKTLIESPGCEQTYESANDTVTQYETQERKMHIFGLDTWWKKLLLIVSIVGIIFFVVTLVVGIARIILPILIPFLAIMFLIKFFRDK